MNQLIRTLGNYTCIYIHITNQAFYIFLQQSASGPFVELCFEAGKWIAWLYLSWDSIPQACAWKWEATFKKVCSRFGQSYELRVGTD